MDTVKTYKQVDKADKAVSFSISRLEDVYAKSKGEIPVPHRHDFYTVLLVKKGKGSHIIDFNEYQLHDHQVFFISPGQVHQLIENEQSIGYGMTFSSQFLLENNIRLCFVSDLNLFNNSDQSPPIELDPVKLEVLSGYCEEIFEWDQSDKKFNNEAIGSLLKLFLIECNNICNRHQNGAEILDSTNSILKNFRELVEQNYSVWHGTTEYANELNITPDHLNRTIKSMIGKTAKEYIQTRITLAAKRMLYFSDLTSKEIAYELGFDEPSNFTTFFKKQSNSTPAEFRKRR